MSLKNMLWLALAASTVIFAYRSANDASPAAEQSPGASAGSWPRTSAVAATVRRPRSGTSAVGAVAPETSAAWRDDEEVKPAGRSQELADLSERILELWRSAADRGVPDEELSELAGWLSDPDPRIAELVARAVADLEHLREQIAAESRASDDPESSFGDEGGDLGTGDGSGLRAERGLADRIEAIDQASTQERLEAIRELWRYAADNGIPRDALDELERLAQAEIDPASVEQARKAVDDLKTLAEHTRSENAAEGGDVASASGESADLPPFGGAASLERRYLEEPSPEKRAGLLQPIAASADESALNLLVEASRDPATPIRHEAINLLWRRAADRPGDTPEILGALDTATHDADPGVSATAILAADDLRSLR